MNSYITADFHTALTNHGLLIDPHAILSNQLTRIKTKEDKAGQKSGWYHLFDNKNDFYVGIYGNWRHDTTFKTWLNKKRLSTFEHNAFLQNIKRYKELKIKEHSTAIASINQRFSSFNTCTTHPYLQRKQVNAHGDLRIDTYGNLIIPMYNIDANLVGYQQILPQKPLGGTTDKYIAKGSQAKNAMYFIGLNQDITLANCDLFLISEGYATCASVYEALNEVMEGTTFCAITTFSAHNILPVVNKIIERYPNKPIWLIADNDIKNGSDNVGVNTCNKIKAMHPNHLILVYIPSGGEL